MANIKATFCPPRRLGSWPSPVWRLWRIYGSAPGPHGPQRLRRCVLLGNGLSGSIHFHLSDNAWNVPFIHNAFANAGATISGVEAAYKGLLQRAGKIPADKKIKSRCLRRRRWHLRHRFAVLSGAMERGHDIVYVCYDNGAYMNTGIQRSSATPKGAWATTSEVGKRTAGQAPEAQGSYLHHGSSWCSLMLPRLP